MRDGCYANGFPFDSHLADFRFFSLFFSGLHVWCYLYGLVLGLGLRLRFILILHL